MDKYKKVLIISCIIMNCFIMSSCFSYRDINKVLLITALVVDVDNTGNPIVYGEAVKGTRGTSPQGMDERILFKGTGKTMLEAVRNMSSTSSYNLNYTQNKAILFTQKAAEHGIGDFIDFFDRDQQLLIRPYIVVYVGDPEKLMKMNIAEEKYIGFFITELIENIGRSSRAVKLSFNEFYIQRTMGDKTSVVSIIDIPKDSLDSTLEINGGAVIKDDKMISILSKAEGQGFNFLMNTVKGGTLEITNPCEINKFVTLEIVKSKTKSEISYYDNIIHLTKKIKVNTNIGDVQKSLLVTKENIVKIEETSEDNIVRSCNGIFQKYKDMGVDIFDITEEFNAKYPKIKIEDIINRTELKVEVEVKVMNTGIVKNFQ